MLHITTLFLTLIFKHAPSLIEQGYVYVACPPLYIVKEGKKTWYSRNDETLNISCAERLLKKYTFYKEDDKKYSVLDISRYLKDIYSYNKLFNKYSKIFTIPEELFSFIIDNTESIDSFSIGKIFYDNNIEFKLNKNIYELRYNDNPLFLTQEDILNALQELFPIYTRILNVLYFVKDKEQNEVIFEYSHQYFKLIEENAMKGLEIKYLKGLRKT